MNKYIKLIKKKKMSVYAHLFVITSKIAGISKNANDTNNTVINIYFHLLYIIMKILYN